MLDKQFPYESFGKKIKKIRTESNKSLRDVSGAVELAPDQLSKIESGILRPSEELIAMLVNHFGLSQDQTEELLKLAGYNHEIKEVLVLKNKLRKKYDDHDHPKFEQDTIKHLLFYLNNSHIYYTDEVKVSTNKHGITIQFMQSLPVSKDKEHNRSIIVSRLGMSAEHANVLAQVLGEAVQKFKEINK